jgi:hypothetical protein
MCMGSRVARIPKHRRCDVVDSPAACPYSLSVCHRWWRPIDPSYFPCCVVFLLLLLSILTHLPDRSFAADRTARRIISRT